MKKILLILITLAGLVGGWFYWGNVYAIEPGVAYRSAQLTPARLTQVIEANGIKSILNLRGPSDSKWYTDEVELCKSLNVEHVDWKLSAVRMVPREEIDMILDVIDTMSKPVLIHCQGGADRSGLVSAAWLYDNMQVSAEEAKGHLSFLYGHLPWFGNPTIAMDLSFQRYLAWEDRDIRPSALKALE